MSHSDVTNKERKETDLSLTSTSIRITDPRKSSLYLISELLNILAFFVVFVI